MSFFPLDANLNASQYPTLVIEVSFSQTIESLRENAKTFLEDFQGEIKVVVLVKFDYRADLFELPALSWVESWRRNAVGRVYKASSVVNISSNLVNVEAC